MKLTISASPHIHAPLNVKSTMWHVVIALLPALICSLVYFGLGSAVVITVSIASCVVFEYLITRYMLGRKPDISNGAAVLTGLLLAFNLPSNLPWWIVVIGALVAIGVGKMAFGGLGCNIFNPALVGRVFLLLSFPAQMTSWPMPGHIDAYTNATTGATLLSQIKMGTIDASQIDYLGELLGKTAGSLGEVSAIALLLGLVYLLWKKIITWHIPVSIIVTVAIFSMLIGSNPMLEVMGGGLLLGAIFMATDYVTSPMTYRGMLIYGVMIGVITVVIRHWGAYPEGMSFAILLMNGFTPIINRYVKPVRFGERRVAA